MSSELANWAQIAAAPFAAIGLFLTAYQISRVIRQRRIERVDEVRRELFGNEELQQIYYKLEYQEFKYTAEFHTSEEEKHLDKLLSMFDSLAKQVELGLLSVKDLDLVAYEYIVTYQDPSVQDYFTFLDGWFEDRGMRRRPFQAFRLVATKLEKLGYGRSA